MNTNGFNLSKIHLPDSLKIIHVNIDSFSSKGLNLAAYLKCLKFQFNIICLTEIRFSTIGIIQKEFPNFDIYIDNPLIAKGGVAILLRKDNFKEVTEIDFNDNFNLKNKLARFNCMVENKWLSFKSGNRKIILGGIYRHPNGETDHFNEALKKTLSQNT